MSTTLRSLFVIGFLFAGLSAGCAVEDDGVGETPEEHAAHTQEEQADETSQAKVEDPKLAVQKKPITDLSGRKESPKK